MHVTVLLEYSVELVYVGDAQAPRAESSTEGRVGARGGLQLLAPYGPMGRRLKYQDEVHRIRPNLRIAVQEAPRYIHTVQVSRIANADFILELPVAAICRPHESSTDEL